MLEFKGKLYGSKTGYLLLQVPNSLAIGFYRALPEMGIVLPMQQGQPFNAHITVMTPDEVQQVGGMENVNERGRDFAYSVIGANEIESSYSDRRYSKYWVLQVRSPELAKLRRTYGMTSSPDTPFHITFAARPRHVVYENGISKLSEVLMTKQAYVSDTRQLQIGSDTELVDTCD